MNAHIIDQGKTWPEAGTVAEGDLLWTPGEARIDDARITKFIAWLSQDRGLRFDTYDALHQWSVNDIDGFWHAIWDYFEVISDTPLTRAVSDGDMFKARWFEGTRTNYAEHLLRHEAVAGAEEVAIVHCSETRPVRSVSWAELGARVRKLATRMRQMGIGPGDRVVSYMPNILETAIAHIATAAIGAVWSSAAPEFGAPMVIERFAQIAPKLAFFADGYSFNGRVFDRRPEIQAIVDGLPSLEHVVWLSYMDLGGAVYTQAPVTMFETMLSGPEIAREAFVFERVAFDHPLWILFSSGTTGLPKAIVHSHVGILSEYLKATILHCDMRPGKRMFFYTTTTWVIWNGVISALIAGATSVLYDGSPVHGGTDALWRIADETGTTMFGASPTLVALMKKAKIRPCELHPLSGLDTVVVGGAPSTPEIFQWFYENVRKDLWVTSQSGGTEIGGGMLTGVPVLPVYAGEIQCAPLGFDTQVWNDAGERITGQVGELVITRPFPSAPLYFWKDEDDKRYFDSYFTTYRGIWRHGDLAKMNARGGAYVYGRSDATLNRYGVRIGSAEIYRILERIPGIRDSLIVCVETKDGGYFMPLMISLEDGTILTDTLRRTIETTLATEASPRHVPDEIHAAPGIPYTLTGKKMEVPVRKLIMGMSSKCAASRDAMTNPELLDWYAAFADRPEVTALRQERQFYR